MGAVLLLVSLAAWTGFLRIEQRAEAPILDPQIFMNRTFMTAAGAIFLSYFGMLGIMAYGPIFVQTVMKISPTVSGTMQTPYTMLVAFMGIPTGFILARTGKYKRMYIIAYAIATIALFAMWQFTAVTPIWWYVLVTSLAGFGLGVNGTITTLVAQFAVPKRLLGAAVGAIFFFQMIGLVVAPPILGLAQNSAPDLESGLKLVFLVGAVAMMIALLMILTIPEISMDAETPENREPLMPTLPVETPIS
jgi:MFS family permease